MLIAMGPSGRLRAREARRGDPFHCPVCIASVILRKGTIRIPHFAHKAHSTCIHTGKSQKHYEMQEKIHALLIQDSANNEVQLEKHFPAIGRVADVAFQRGGFTFVIECQVSPIDSREIRARDAAYARAGAKVIWVLDAGRKYTHGGKVFLRRRGWGFERSEAEHFLHEQARGRVLYYFSNEAQPFWEVVFTDPAKTPQSARPLERISPIEHPYKVAVAGTTGADALAEPGATYADVEKWLAEAEQEGGEKMSPLVARLRDHWRKEDGPHALDGRWKDFMEMELGGNKITLTKGVRGGPAIQQLWRASAFHRFIHGSKAFAVLAILRFLRKHFEVNLAYLRRDIEGWLQLLAGEGIIAPVDRAKGVWRFRPPYARKPEA